jgi:hypothetical protein
VDKQVQCPVVDMVFETAMDIIYRQHNKYWTISATSITLHPLRRVILSNIIRQHCHSMRQVWKKSTRIGVFLLVYTKQSVKNLNKNDWDMAGSTVEIKQWRTSGHMAAILCLRVDFETCRLIWSIWFVKWPISWVNHRGILQKFNVIRATKRARKNE